MVACDLASPIPALLTPRHAPAGKTGVYVIRNRVNGKVYVGSSATNIAARWNTHRHSLRNGTHHSRHLQRAWIRHGEESFSFSIIAICGPKWCLAVEQLCILANRSCDGSRGYNIAVTAGSNLGSKRTPEQVRANIERQKGRRHTPEQRQKMLDAIAARMADPARRSRALANLERSRVLAQSEASRKRHSDSLREYWKNPNPKHLENRVKASRSESCRLKHSLNKRGIKFSDEHKAKISRSQKGRIFSEETKQRMSVAAKARCATADGISHMIIARSMSPVCKRAAP